MPLAVNQFKNLHSFQRANLPLFLRSPKTNGLELCWGNGCSLFSQPNCRKRFDERSLFRSGAVILVGARKANLDPIP